MFFYGFFQCVLTLGFKENILCLNQDFPFDLRGCTGFDWDAVGLGLQVEFRPPDSEKTITAENNDSFAMAA